MSNTQTMDTASERGLVPRQPTAGLLIAWSRSAPERVGQLFLPRRFGAVHTIGRGDEPTEQGSRLLPVRLRPGEIAPQPPLQDPRMSRAQLAVSRRGDARLQVENLGRRAMSINNAAASAGEVSVGDVVTIDRCMVLLCVSVAPDLGWADTPPPFDFGAPDASGMVGESAALWALRQRLARLAGSKEHVLLFGESGTGKELAAQALHGGGPFQARSAATFPEGLIDAELFGNAENYPQSGMPARPGLVGAADGGTLFLDELAELPEALQARLLRVLDHGEYHRLGEHRARRARFRLVAATNRPESSLKHDLLARFPYRLTVPTLNDRREDIPLLIPHLLRHAAGADPALERFFPPGSAHPRLSAELVVSLLTHRYTTHVRELRAMLLAAALESHDTLSLPPRAAAEDWRRWAGTPAEDLPPDAIQAALDAHNGHIESTWQALGLSSRHVLRRLIQRHGLVVRKKG